MSILGIANRTENWKTVEHFYGLSEEAKQRLAKRLCEAEDAHGKDIQVELFWYGMRDYVHKFEKNEEDFGQELAACYLHLFSNLHQQLYGFRHKHRKYHNMNSSNYDLSDGNRKDKEAKLCSNLYETEIDILLQTPKRLFIGEAKYETDSFGAVSKYVLVHQLIRQYVMAKILLRVLGCKKAVIPFVVGRDIETLKGRGQFKFIVEQDWLDEGNILSWDEVKDLACES